jgi:hypothetical protein
MYKFYNSKYTLIECKRNAKAKVMEDKVFEWFLEGGEW